jgi:hypothetical protein
MKTIVVKTAVTLFEKQIKNETFWKRKKRENKKKLSLFEDIE